MSATEKPEPIVHQTMDAFLASVERRAYKHALYAVRNEENALDIVQDAMLNLVQSYRDKPPTEWPMLFTRILQNAIHNHFRRNKVRDYWTPKIKTSLSSAKIENKILKSLKLIRHSDEFQTAGIF